MAYIGREPQIGNYQVCDAISVVNAQAAYTMQVNSVNVIPESVNHMIVSLNGVIQNPGGDNPSYTISSSTITFSSNLATGDSIDFIYLLGNVLDLGTPSDDTVTGAKIVDNAINSEHYTDGSIDTAHIADAQITVAKMAANSIDSDQYVDGSIDTAHIAADQITAAKIADDAISEEHLDVTAVTGHTAETSIADGDLVLIHDASASALRKMTKANFVSGIGGVTMSDIFRLSANLSFNSSNTAAITANLERDDTSGAGFIGTGMSESSGIFTFPSTGIYQVDFHPNFYRDGSSQWIESQIQVTTNNSSYATLSTNNLSINRVSSTNTYTAGSLSCVVDVTNTSNVKVRFMIAGAQGPIIMLGNSTKNITNMIFTKLGDT